MKINTENTKTETSTKNQYEK